MNVRRVWVLGLGVVVGHKYTFSCDDNNSNNVCNYIHNRNYVS